MKEFVLTAKEVSKEVKLPIQKIYTLRDCSTIATNPRRYQAISRALIPEEGGDRRKGIFVGGVC